MPAYELVVVGWVGVQVYAHDRGRVPDLDWSSPYRSWFDRKIVAVTSYLRRIPQTRPTACVGRVCGGDPLLRVELLVTLVAQVTFIERRQHPREGI